LPTKVGQGLEIALIDRRIGERFRADRRHARERFGIPTIAPERGRGQYELARPLRILDGEPQRDATAEGIAQKVGLREAKMLHQRGDVVGHRLVMEWAVDVGGVPMPLQLDANDLARLGKFWHERAHRLDGHEAARQHDQRSTAAPMYLVVDIQAVDRGVGHPAISFFVISISCTTHKEIDHTFHKHALS
jgi:hypothetical protein